MPVEVVRPADRTAWLAARKQDVTASVAAAVLHAHPYTTPYRLWAEKTGRVAAEIEETEAMERGTLMEPVAVALTRKRFPDWQVTYEDDRAYYRDPALRIGATPDAQVRRPDRVGVGNYQIKTVSEDAFRAYWFDPDTREIVPPTWIAVQSIVEAKLTGCDYASVGLLVITWRGTLRLEIVDIPLHQKLWARLCDAVAAFWQMVDSGGQPPPDWDRDGETVVEIYSTSFADRRDLTGDPDLEAIIGRYVEATRARAAAERLADTLRPQIIYALGNSEAGTTGAWDITAKTTFRDAYTVRATSARILRVKPRKDTSRDF